MHIKVDEDLPAQATQRLRAEGYDASSVVEQKMGAGKTRKSGKRFKRSANSSSLPTRGLATSGSTRHKPMGVCCCCGLMKMASGLSSTCWTKCWQHTG